MIDWDDLRYFLAVHRAGTLAGAAQKLRINPTTVGRRLAALEEQVGARLFDRTPDGYVATKPGQNLLPRAERMEEEAIALEREVAGADQKLEGIVRITVTEMLATRFLTPHLPAFHSRYPGITLELRCSSNQAINLGRREADIALRLARPKEENVVTRRIATIHLSPYASKSYIEQRGMPENPEESLSGHDLVMFASSRAFAKENDWFEPRLEGTQVVMRSDSVSSIMGAVMAGLGIGLLPRAVADLEPALVRLHADTGPEPRVVWQTVHRDLKDTARIRAVLDFIKELLTESRGEFAPP